MRVSGSAARDASDPRVNESLEADYLVVGGGAMGMAFADEILHANKAARVVVVDRRAKPGGHWNDAYRFVTLHQPALFYGVNSRKLGAGGKDLVSQAQILAYYELVQKDLEATGRFHFLARSEADPLAEGGGDVVVRSLLDDSAKRVVRARKVVDATYMDVRVPSTTKPKYAIEGRAQLVPINGLVDRETPFERYVVLGAGKTGIDAVLYLLDQNVDPDAISWVVPNDAWFLNRDNIQPDAFADELLDQIVLLRDAPNLGAVLGELESRDRLLRLSPDVHPTKYRCATVTKDELDRLRRVSDVIRQGRVARIDGATLHFENASERRFEEGVPGVLYVDCTADGLAPRPARPIWDAGRITLQSISMCQQVMSAASIAALELREADDVAKNALLTPVPHPRVPADFLYCFRQTIVNQQALGQKLLVWSLTRRLSGIKHLPWFDILRVLVAGVRIPPPTIERIDTLAGRRAAASPGPGSTT